MRIKVSNMDLTAFLRFVADLRVPLSRDSGDRIGIGAV